MSIRKEHEHSDERQIPIEKSQAMITEAKLRIVELDGEVRRLVAEQFDQFRLVYTHLATLVFRNGYSLLLPELRLLRATAIVWAFANRELLFPFFEVESFEREIDEKFPLETLNTG